jgi:hypothetical protein
MPEDVKQTFVVFGVKKLAWFGVQLVDVEVT